MSIGNAIVLVAVGAVTAPLIAVIVLAFATSVHK